MLTEHLEPQDFETVYDGEFVQEFTRAEMAEIKAQEGYFSAAQVAEQFGTDKQTVTAIWDA